MIYLAENSHRTIMKIGRAADPLVRHSGLWSSAYVRFGPKVGTFRILFLISGGAYEERKLIKMFSSLALLGHSNCEWLKHSRIIPRHFRRIGAVEVRTKFLPKKRRIAELRLGRVR